MLVVRGGAAISEPSALIDSYVLRQGVRSYWLCVKHRHRTPSTASMEVLSCPACLGLTDEIGGLSKIRNCGRCNSPKVQILHMTEGCEYACENCGNRRSVVPCPLQLLARDVILSEQLALDSEPGTPPPLPPELEALLGLLEEGEGYHLKAHFYIEGTIQGIRQGKITHVQADPSVRKFKLSPEARSSFLAAEEKFGQADYRGALRSYEKAETIDPSSSIVQLHKGDAYFALGKIEEAIACYRASLALDPFDYQAYRYLADAYYRLKKPRESWSALVSAVVCKPDYGNAWKDLAVLARAGGMRVRRHRVRRLAHVETGLNGKLVVVLDQRIATGTGAKREAWAAYGKTLAEGLEGVGRDPWRKHRRNVTPEVNAYRTLAETWANSKLADPTLEDEELDFLARVRSEDLLDAYIFLEEFEQGMEPDFEKWKIRNPDAAYRYLRTHVFVPAPPSATG